MDDPIVLLFDMSDAGISNLVNENKKIEILLNKDIIHLNIKRTWT